MSTASSRYVQRTNRFCGLKNEQPLPSCGALEACFLNKTGDGLLAFELCVENEIHANLHGVHGGYWDCPVDLDAFADAHAWASRPLLSFLTATIAENVLTKPQKVFDYVQCPGACALGVDDAATCHCWSTVPNVTSLNDTQVYAYLETALAKLHSSYKGPHFMTLSPVTGKHAFAGLTVEQDFSLKRLYLELLRAPGRFGVWPTGAAPIDPLFWPMHPIFDKMTQALRMAPAFAATVNFTWDNAGMCDAGDPQSAEWWGKQPFEDLFGASEAAAARDDGGDRHGKHDAKLGARKLARSYSNADLWELFRPDGDDIPYVYDQLAAWGTCDWDPLAVTAGELRWNATANATA